MIELGSAESIALLLFFILFAVLWVAGEVQGLQKYLGRIADALEQRNKERR